MEEQLVREGVLDLDGIGVEDNFPELGGDSLLASQVISRVIHAFRVELALSNLNAVATVADMTVAITRNLAGQTDAEDVERTLLELEALAGEQHLTDEDESSGVRDF